MRQEFALGAIFQSWVGVGNKVFSCFERGARAVPTFVDIESLSRRPEFFGGTQMPFSGKESSVVLDLPVFLYRPHATNGTKRTG